MKDLKAIEAENKKKKFLNANRKVSSFIFNNNLWREVPMIVKFVGRARYVLGYSKKTNVLDILRALKKVWEGMDGTEGVDENSQGRDRINRD